jgi:hypothetical protein
MPDPTGITKKCRNTARASSVSAREAPADPRVVATTAVVFTQNHTTKQTAACVAASELNIVASAA